MNFFKIKIYFNQYNRNNNNLKLLMTLLQTKNLELYSYKMNTDLISYFKEQ